MGGQEPKRVKKHICAGLLAHVDAGKTTLSEAILYACGAIRKMGRVDRQDAFLDTHALERERGITIFSKQAVLQLGDIGVTLLDTPGHVDFSAEMERTLQVLDYAVLVISGADGVQGHTATLWRLLQKYRIPVFLFINKMDQPGTGRERLLRELKGRLSDGCMDFGAPHTDDFLENAAMGCESALEEYLETGALSDSTLRAMIRDRKLFPCYFGSALKAEGVDALLQGMEDYMDVPPAPEVFGARVFKIERDAQGNRLTHVKVTGGVLRVRSVLSEDGAQGGEPWEEKVNQIRIYSGERFEAVQEAGPGVICALTGLSYTYPGQGLGKEAGVIKPILSPVLSYRIQLPEGCDAAVMLPKLRQLEEEEPQLHIAWEERLQEIHAQVMGEVQTEVVKRLIADRFGVNVEFGEGSIVYKETIAGRVIGAGHYEPLRHYAEVHLLMEPGEPGSGLVFSADCREEVLERNWQRLVLTHLKEKEHKGVLTGSPITDMRITLVAGRAHLKHTEGGDFRQATYRAVRQGLFEAQPVLLEPYYSFRLEVPQKQAGRAIADLERMHACYDMRILPGMEQNDAQEDGMAALTGSAPVACMRGYQKEVVSYTRGCGRLSCTLKGYGPCHNAQEVTERIGYDAERDADHPGSSVFCAHGAGFVVEWDRAKEYMHVDSSLVLEKAGGSGWGEGASSEGNPGEGEGGQGAGRARLQAGGHKGGEKEVWIGTEEVDAILEKALYANVRDKAKDGRKGWNRRRERPGGYTAGSGEAKAAGTAGGVRESAPAGREGLAGGQTTGASEGDKPKDRAVPDEAQEEYLLVDGYNIIFAWDDLKELAQVSIDGARGKLQDILCNYQGIRGCRLILVFDAYRVQGHDTECSRYHNIQVVYTKEAETADRYIERFAHEHGRRYRVTVATSDGLEQIIIRGQGCGLISARELRGEIKRAAGQLMDSYERDGDMSAGRHYLFDGLEEEAALRMERIRRGKEGNRN